MKRFLILFSNIDQFFILRINLKLYRPILSRPGREIPLAIRREKRRPERTPDGYLFWFCGKLEKQNLCVMITKNKI